MQELLARLTPTDAEQVAEMWDALLTARRDCEAMAARGVRISRDISRDWQETVSDLIDRVVAQDSELGQLRLQVRMGQSTLEIRSILMMVRPLSPGGPWACCCQCTFSGCMYPVPACKTGTHHAVLGCTRMQEWGLLAACVSQHRS